MVAGSIVKELTANECTGLGGTVNDVGTKKCDSGKACITADKEGVLRSVCIDNKSN